MGNDSSSPNDETYFKYKLEQCTLFDDKYVPVLYFMASISLVMVFIQSIGVYLWLNPKF
jgi:hypothetical protein